MQTISGVMRRAHQRRHQRGWVVTLGIVAVLFQGTGQHVNRIGQASQAEEEPQADRDGVGNERGRPNARPADRPSAPS